MDGISDIKAEDMDDVNLPDRLCGHCPFPDDACSFRWQTLDAGRRSLKDLWAFDDINCVLTVQ